MGTEPEPEKGKGDLEFLFSFWPSHSESFRFVPHTQENTWGSPVVMSIPIAGFWSGTNPGRP